MPCRTTSLALSNQCSNKSWSGSASNVSLFSRSAMSRCILELWGHLACRLEKDSLPSKGLSMHNKTLCPMGVSLFRQPKNWSAICSVIVSLFDNDIQTVRRPEEAFCTAALNIRLVFPWPPFPAIITGESLWINSSIACAASLCGTSASALMTWSMVWKLLLTVKKFLIVKSSQEILASVI